MVFLCEPLNQSATMLKKSALEIIGNPDIHYGITLISE